ncbi:hypothetical protein SEA_BOBBY_93 [Mycobacterium phage Bobby]|nr:hypothetical protein SEA_BOBBY_93 [Mycobacterium phage Bobby]
MNVNPAALADIADSLSNPCFGQGCDAAATWYVWSSHAFLIRGCGGSGSAWLCDRHAFGFRAETVNSLGGVCAHCAHAWDGELSDHFRAVGVGQ